MAVKSTGAARSAAIADRRSTANIAAPKTLSASQLQTVTQLPGVVTDVAATQRRVAAEQAAAARQNAGPAADASISTAAATPDVSVDTLTKTPEYLARERAIQAAMNQFTAGQATDLARYNEDYGRNLTELGYNANTGFDRGNLLSSGQRATTSGKAYNALGDDFAARGMLQSGAYQARQGVLGTQLEDQRQALDRAKLRFSEDQNKALLAQQAQNEQQRQAALDAARQSILASWGA